MKKSALLFLSLMTSFTIMADNQVVSPDGKIVVRISTDEGRPHYYVAYQGQEVVKSSALGLVTNIGDYTQGLVEKGFESKTVKDSYSLANIKQSRVDYEATEAVVRYEQDGKPAMDITFRVSNRDVAFRYTIYPKKETRVCVVEREASSFALPDGTTTFLCPQSKPMGGFARTSPSYETSYTLDDSTGKNGWGEGYTFPCLFRTSADNWVLISETGTDGGYVGCRLLNEQGSTYAIGFPQEGEMNGIGSTTPAMALPGSTPWRTITVGPLANIVETTVPFDLVEQALYRLLGCHGMAERAHRCLLGPADWLRAHGRIVALRPDEGRGHLPLVQLERLVERRSTDAYRQAEQRPHPSPGDAVDEGQRHSRHQGRFLRR